MDIAILIRHLRDRISFRPTIVVTAFAVLGAFVWVKASTDLLSLYAAAGGLILIFLGERIFMRSHVRLDGTMEM